MERGRSSNTASTFESISHSKSNRTINYREELCLYFYNEMLPYIIQASERKMTVRTSIDETHFAKQSDETVDRGGIQTPELESYSTIKTESKGSATLRSEETDDRRKSKLTTISEGTSTTKQDDLPLEWFVEKKDDAVVIQFKNGCVYMGQTKNEMLHGKGHFRWSDGANYDGEFSNGQMTGFGEFTFSEGSKYTGQFCNGRLHGYGCFNCMGTEMIYDGEWKFGKKDGKGWLLYDKNSIYRGQFKNDRKSGLGKREYSNGAIYYGSWLNGYRHGEGTMLFDNKDFYKGEWFEGKQHGYGEYTWNASLNFGFALAQENIYQGQWVNGERDGYGVMHFGQDSTKLASFFKRNMKHGAGIMICGNGNVFERSPLFINDSPIHGDEMDAETLQFLKSLKSMSLSDIKAPYDRRPKKSLESNAIDDIHSLSSGNKTESPFPVVNRKETPLHMPFHAPATDLKLDYHIQKLSRNYAINNFDPEEFGINASKWNLLESFKLTEDIAMLYTTGSTIDVRLEERKLRNVIIKNFPYLEQLYIKYGSLTCKTKSIKPVLSRMFLWQMYRDFDLQHHEISLIDTDLMLLDFPNNYLETAHYPFEKIYMWQFLHSILCVAYKIYAKPEFSEKYKEKGIFAKMLEKFLEEYVIPNSGRGLGQCLFKYKNLLPIHSVYLLYKDIGEPHTVKTFIKRCCVRIGDNLKCYLKVSCLDKPPDIPIACNAVCTGSNFIYLSEEPDLLGKKVKEKCPFPYKRDPFYKNLIVFHVLGVSQILSSVAKICPLIKKDGFIVNVEYKMTFLEFYEVLLICAEELALFYKTREEKEMKMAEEACNRTVTTKSSSSKRISKISSSKSIKK